MAPTSSFEWEEEIPLLSVALDEALTLVGDTGNCSCLRSNGRILDEYQMQLGVSDIVTK